MSVVRRRWPMISRKVIGPTNDSPH
jgi:hypothetical protein